MRLYLKYIFFKNKKMNLCPVISMKIMKYSEIEKYKFIPPDFQRIMNKDRIDDLYNNIKDVTNNFEKQYYPYGCITLSETTDDSKIHILDGQHRLATFNRIYQESNMDISFFCQLIKVKDAVENENLFKSINNSLPLSILPEGIKRLPISYAVKVMKDKYGTFFSNTRSKRRPFINGDCVEEHLGEVMILLKKETITSDEYMHILEKYNGMLQERNRHFFTPYGRDIDKFHKKCFDMGGLYVGLITDYSWVYNMFGLQKPKEEEDEMVSLNNNAYRNMIYERDNHKCCVCGKVTSREEFHMGHIKSKSNGGTSKADNICLLCPSCNMSIGRKDIPDFCRVYNIPWNK
jgi:hypothetical protein